MYKLHDMFGTRYEALGEIDKGLTIYRNGERIDVADVWPGKRSDLASLERNAAAFRNAERRRFFRALGRLAVSPVRAALAKRRAARSADGQDLNENCNMQDSSINNFANILAGSYNAALYKGQIPHKDYRDD